MASVSAFWASSSSLLASSSSSLLASSVDCCSTVFLHLFFVWRSFSSLMLQKTLWSLSAPLGMLFLAASMRFFDQGPIVFVGVPSHPCLRQVVLEFLPVAFLKFHLSSRVCLGAEVGFVGMSIIIVCPSLTGSQDYLVCSRRPGLSGRMSGPGATVLFWWLSWSTCCRLRDRSVGESWLLRILQLLGQLLR